MKCKNATKAALRKRFKDRSYGSGVLKIDLKTCAEHTSRNLSLINSRCRTTLRGICRLKDFGSWGIGINKGWPSGYAVVDVGGGFNGPPEERFAMIWASPDMLADWLFKRMSVISPALKKKLRQAQKIPPPVVPPMRQRQVLS